MIMKLTDEEHELLSREMLKEIAKRLKNGVKAIPSPKARNVNISHLGDEVEVIKELGDRKMKDALLRIAREIRREERQRELGGLNRVQSRINAQRSVNASIKSVKELQERLKLILEYL